MEHSQQRETALNDSNRFVFCSSNGAHLRWLAHALKEWHVVQQELAPIALLTARVAECKPRLVLLDFSGNCGDSTCLLYTSPSPRDQRGSRMPSSA